MGAKELSTPRRAATGLIGSPTIETLDSMKVAGIHRSMSFADPAMRELWQAFRPRANEIPSRASEDFVSLRVFEQPVRGAPTLESRFEQWAAVEVTQFNDLPQGIDSHVLGGGMYALFTYRGRASDFATAARYIYGEWLPGSDYEVDDREFFEILGPAYRPDDPHATEKVWIPVRLRDRVSERQL